MTSAATSFLVRSSQTLQTTLTGKLLGQSIYSGILPVDSPKRLHLVMRQPSTFVFEQIFFSPKFVCSLESDI